MAVETTLVLVKPDGMQRQLAGEILARLERRGLELRGARLLKISRSLAGQHYAEHKGKPFFEGLVDFITSGPLVAMILEGLSAVEAARQVIGKTDPIDAEMGSIRADFALEMRHNLVHGSDSEESAAREIALFFGD